MAEKLNTLHKLQEEEHQGHLKQNRVVSLAKLQAHPDNYKLHPEPQLNNLKASLSRFGQGRSIVVQDGPNGYLIVAGHGVVEAARQLGYTELRADILPADWSPEQVKGYLVADNQHGEQAETDQDILVRLLQEQQQAGYDLASLGTDELALEDMLASITPPTLDELTDEYGDEPDAESLWPMIRIKVPPETKELYDSLMEDARGDTEGEQFAWLLARVNLAEGEK